MRLKLFGGVVAVATVSLLLTAALSPASSRSNPRFPYGGTGNSYVEKYCATYNQEAEYCLPGKGSPTAGGGSKVTHAGWPFNNGLYWKVFSEGTGKHHFTGGPKNDELLGHNGSDTINGGAGDDVIWGDWEQSHNGTSQHDTLIGGEGNDYIYTSHGTNTVNAGPGNDHISAYYGHGTIDCGPGHDEADVRENHAYTLKNCEVVRHF